MAKEEPKTTESYKQFAEMLDQYVHFKGAYDRAENGDGSKKIANIAASLYEPPELQQRTLAVRDAEELAEILKTGVKAREKRIDILSKANLEDLIKGMPDQEQDIAIETMKPKDNYSGQYAEMCKKVDEIKAKSISLRKGGLKKVQDELTHTYENRTYEGDREEQIALAKVLIKYDKVFVSQMAEKMISDLQTELKTTLGDKKANYLVEHLRDKNFLKFYMDLQETIKQLIEQQKSQRQE